MTKKTLIATAIMAMSCIGSVWADEMVLLQIYGSGVHAFNQGDYNSANAAFTAAIKGGINDPRPYYFRGLTFLRFGRNDDARLDFEKGAELEAVDIANVTLVSRSLERIQGRARQSLEQYRTVVRAAAVQRKEADDRAIRQELAAEEMKVRRQIRPIELPSNPDMKSAGAQSMTPGGDENPFAIPAAAGNRGETMTKPTTPTGPSTAPADNIFEPAPTRPAPRPAPGVEDNPFGEPTKPTPRPADAGNPFGEAAPPQPRNSTPPPSGESPSAPTAASGAISSLFNAFVQGIPSDEPVAPANPPSFEMPGMLRGILGGGPTGMPPANTAPMPAPGNPTAPAKDSDPFSDSPPQIAPMPIQQAPPPALMPPQQTLPTPPKPADDNDPFK